MAAVCDEADADEAIIAAAAAEGPPKDDDVASALALPTPHIHNGGSLCSNPQAQSRPARSGP